MRMSAWVVVLSVMGSTSAMAVHVGVAPCVMQLKYKKDGPNPDVEGRQPFLKAERRLVDNLGDVNNATLVTTGFGKCHVKLSTKCGPQRQFVAIDETGFQWKLVEKTNPGSHFQATVNTIICIPK